MDCIGCHKKLKKGEFVVLNGGAMVKTKNGASMGNKNLIGFLSVNNHFDSKKNYRSMCLMDNAPNGQFEFYACSHKCLADFMSRQIMQLKKFDKIRKITIAPATKLDKIGYEWADKVVQMMGFKGALVTDESTVYDFMGLWSNEKDNDKFILKLNKKFGFKIQDKDYIWQIAKKLKDQESCG
jgi:hypothetical protein